MAASAQRKVFLNYRRDDEHGFALLLYTRLESAFSAQRLFMDVEDSIKQARISRRQSIVP
jgi:hypothetical protein